MDLQLLELNFNLFGIWLAEITLRSDNRLGWNGKAGFNNRAFHCFLVINRRVNGLNLYRLANRFNYSPGIAAFRCLTSTIWHKGDRFGRRTGRLRRRTRGFWGAGRHRHWQGESGGDGKGKRRGFRERQSGGWRDGIGYRYRRTGRFGRMTGRFRWTGRHRHRQGESGGWRDGIVIGRHRAGRRYHFSARRCQVTLYFLYSTVCLSTDVVCQEGWYKA